MIAVEAKALAHRYLRYTAMRTIAEREDGNDALAEKRSRRRAAPAVRNAADRDHAIQRIIAPAPGRADESRTLCKNALQICAPNTAVQSAAAGQHDDGGRRQTTTQERRSTA